MPLSIASSISSLVGIVYLKSSLVGIVHPTSSFVGLAVSMAHPCNIIIKESTQMADIAILLFILCCIIIFFTQYLGGWSVAL